MTPTTPKRASVYEVAALAGISIATVSRAINQPHRVSPDTREKVMAAVKQLNYVPDGEAAARARAAQPRVRRSPAGVVRRRGDGPPAALDGGVSRSTRP